MAGILNLMVSNYPQGVSYPPYANGYTYRKKITVPYTNVYGSSNLTDFPLVVSFTDAVLKTVANGGKVVNSSGYDIRFETLGGTKLDHEVETWIDSTGEFVAFVRISSLSYTVDTELYMYYGNSSISATEENRTGVWSSDYKLVAHLNQDPLSTTTLDSTSNANNLTTGGTFISPVITGKVGKGVYFNNNGFLNSSANIGITGAGNRTISFWFNKDDTSSNRNAVGFGAASTGAVDDCLMYGGKIIGHFYGGGYDTISGAPTYSASTWIHYTMTYDGTNVRVYKNGALGNATSMTLNTATSIFRIGQGAYGAFNNWLGSLDEVRVSNVVKTPDWILTEYDNMNSPSGFYSVGAEQHN